MTASTKPTFAGVLRPREDTGGAKNKPPCRRHASVTGTRPARVSCGMRRRDIAFSTPFSSEFPSTEYETKSATAASFGNV
jgi:hypothetical protein